MFLEDGIQNGYLNEAGEIIDVQKAEDRKSMIFDNEYFEKLENRVGRFAKLYEFLIEFSDVWFLNIIINLIISDIGAEGRI